MREIVIIENHKAVDRIIAHLKLTFHAQRPPPRVLQQGLLMAAEEKREYF